jgi:hypothetical protein
MDGNVQQDLNRPRQTEGSRRLMLTYFKNIVRSSAVPIGRLNPHFCQRLNVPHGRNAAGTIMSMKNSNNTIGNGTRDSPGCSGMPQPTAPTRGWRFYEK